MKGGKLEGAGRPKGSNQYGESTQAMRIPLSRIEEVKHFISASSPLTLPLYSCKVKAGFPSPADDYIEAHLNLNEFLIKHPSSTFLLTASGDSMKDAGIHNGDLLIVDSSLEATHGKIVIAAIDGELTVKRLSRTGGQVQLLPENPAFSAIDITENQDLVIWGVVTHVIHQAV
ncbi:DNA polymerase V [Legionella birminghamensis]|uniref:DNA polymerase V n=2 Tax=Legionella birminghamensis TaxID=28083 RepID=A0A378JST6_9GAMM|nr:MULTISPECIES: translesion error-prone DNA polymerase V autoproteolytic subunit [Legionella]KTC69012.1 DNA polymerase V [Legionella birminghamensis]MCE3044164.1 translesion error-prone DNA polymerase V autoproteolytic subunit [Legionella sp. 16cNR16C]SEG41300.1 DNA polymerase V [Legionella quinlivanii DSM 21216]STX61017.1 SOS (error prone) mutagenesis protein UmuD (RumA) [Legionella birminghamensis]